MPKLHSFPTEGNRTEINKDSLEWYRTDRVYFTSFEGIPARLKKAYKFFTLLTFKDDNYDGLERYRQSNIHTAAELRRLHRKAVVETGYFMWEPDKGNYVHLVENPLARSLSIQIAAELRHQYGQQIFGNSRPERAIEKILAKCSISMKCPVITAYEKISNITKRVQE